MEPLAAGDPRQVGPYRLRARLGAGGMGQVFLGYSPAGRAVAVKVVHRELARDPAFRTRREVAAARAVSGAYTAPVTAAGPDDDPPWLATVFVPGPSLADAVAVAGPLPAASVWKLTVGLVEALQAVHACGLVHRDLKPARSGPPPPTARWPRASRWPAESFYLGSNDYMVHALRASDGRKIWASATGGPVTSEIAVAGRIAYVGSNDTKVYALTG